MEAKIITFETKTNNTTTDNFHITFTGLLDLDRSPIVDQVISNLLFSYLDMRVNEHTLEEVLKLIDHDERESFTKDLQSYYLQKQIVLNTFDLTLGIG